MTHSWAYQLEHMVFLCSDSGCCARITDRELAREGQVHNTQQERMILDRLWDDKLQRVRDNAYGY